ncbi:MAG: pyruvate kinase [Planctomycetes bacterium]|nr:pyruvate kinase [Planctomycetota bacterium]
MSTRYSESSLRPLIEQLVAMRSEALRVVSAFERELDQVAPAMRGSARNLLHYLALRNRDLRALQPALVSLGLSSLGRLEAHALPSLEAVLAVLDRLCGRAPDADLPPLSGFEEGRAALARHAHQFFGATPGERATRILVTLSAELAEEPDTVSALLAAGMDAARINCAHDTPEVWHALAARVREASQLQRRPCRLLFDLAGPKLRTAPLPEGAESMHLRPPRDLRGVVREPLRVLFVPQGDPAPATPLHDERVPVLGESFQRIRPGDELRFRDLRGRVRRAHVVVSGTQFALAELKKSAWIESGTTLHLERSGKEIARLHCGRLPRVEERLVVRPGDALWVVPAEVSARAATKRAPARIACTLPEVFTAARAGDPIWFDDGKIGGVIRAVVREGRGAPRLEVEITVASPKGSKLGGDKGINLPRTALPIPALGAADLEALEHVARLGDLVGLSFVREVEDVLQLQGELARLERRDMGIVLKIETARGFENLPRILLAALRTPPTAVMVARGDLGVELGFERLAEVQEEMLWLAEAAHVPVIWATQVLEEMTKRGRPSRAEVTDAAMSARAECVMLNKGPHVLEAVRFLDDVLRRMQVHQQKKSAMLRRLHVCSMVDEALREAMVEG